MTTLQSSRIRDIAANVILCFGILLAPWGDSNLRAQTKSLPPGGLRVGEFDAEVRRTFTVKDSLPTDNVLSLAVAKNGGVFAGTSRGLVKYSGDHWEAMTDYDGAVKLIAAHEDGLIGIADGTLYLVESGFATPMAEIPEGAREPVQQHSLVGGKRVLLGSSAGLFELKDESFAAVSALNDLLGAEQEVRQVAVSDDGRVAVAAASGLFLSTEAGSWTRLAPRQGKRSWALVDVRGVTFDSLGRFWFAGSQGVGRFDEGEWQLWTGHEGLPYDDFTTMAAGQEGAVWFGTRMGAIRFDGSVWEYRMAPRWLPDNLVRAVAVQSNGNAWFATEKGVGLIERVPMTLARKAEYFEEQIDKYNRRTPFGYVLTAGLKNVDDRSEWTNHDSDNDGLWTAMYGAGECFAYAATKDPKAKARAQNAFEALRFLSQVTQGGDHPAPPGFPARTILPTSGEDPNAGRYSPEKDRESQKRDPLWKLIWPRWPTSADGKWYWKTDTSSDELDGHYFLYALYYDLVAETEEEKKRVRDVVVAITDHLIDHGYDLVDHDGKPTRWARFAPDGLNGGVTLFQRGLNSLSIISYLKAAVHITGDAKYEKHYQLLLRKHGYLANILAPKAQNGPGSGNQSDDEMAFMCYFNLLAYETDPMLRQIYMWTFYRYWQLEEPELNPLFNLMFAAQFEPNVGVMHMPPMLLPPSCLFEAVDSLKRYPLDRIRWSFKNSHRTDVVRLPAYVYGSDGKGHRRNGKVIPIDERSVEHWNHDSWRLDEGHDGKSLTDGAAFLLPYYMGLYYRFIVE